MQSATGSRNTECAGQPRRRLFSDTASASHRAVRVLGEDGSQEPLPLYGSEGPRLKNALTDPHNKDLLRPVPSSPSRRVHWQNLSEDSSGVRSTCEELQSPSKVQVRRSIGWGLPRFLKFNKKHVENPAKDQPPSISLPMPLRRRAHSDAPSPKRR